MRKNIDELYLAHVFQQVVLSGGFSAAAKVLDLDPSSVTRAVSELEKNLGCTLLRRTTRVTQLTEAGGMYLAHAKKMLSARDEARHALAALSGEKPSGLLRVTMPVLVGERMLSPHLPRFMRMYPDIRLELLLSDQTLSLSEQGIDMAVRIGTLTDSQLIARRLGHVRRALYVSAAYVQAHGTARTPQAVAQHPCIVLAQKTGAAQWHFWKGKQRETVQVNALLHTTSPTVALNAALDGMGIVRLIEWVAKDAVEQGRLIKLLPHWSLDDPRQPGLPVHAVFFPDGTRRIPQKAKVFSEFMQSVFDELQPLSGAA